MPIIGALTNMGALDNLPRSSIIRSSKVVWDYETESNDDRSSIVFAKGTVEVRMNRSWRHE